MAAGVLRFVRGDARHEAMLDAALELVATTLAQNEDLVRAEVASRTYRWLPRWLDERIADKILSGLKQMLEDMRDPGHPWRARVRRYLDDLADRLETDPALAARADRIKRQMASHPALLGRLGDLADTLEARLRPQSEEASQALSQRLAERLVGFGDWLYDEAEAIEIFNNWVRLAVQRTVAPRRREIGRMIASVVASWDVHSVVDKLELQVGADLQYIRINGTVVGGLVGLMIFTLSRMLGA
jgi:uncharacterized membrane-anchored protein YjiN (DUF445 family)